MKVNVEVMETEVYSRCVGYFRPISNWNIGKTQEWKDRKFIILKNKDNKDPGHDSKGIPD